MASCPACAAATLEKVDEVLYCPGCHSSLQPVSELASVLALPAGSPELAVDLDRHGEALGPCPACASGSLRRGRMLGEAIASCSDCDARWIAPGQLARIKSGRVQESASHGPPRDMSSYAERYAASGRIPFDTLAANTYALPAALVVGVLAHVLGFSFLVWATLEMWFHELGHAVVAWLAGFIAVPLPFFTTVPRDDRSVVVVLIVMGMLGAIAYEAGKRRLWALVGFAGALVAVQVLLTFVLNPAQATQWWIFAGQGGAIVLPTLVMLAFYQRIGWRWDFWRYPAVLVAAIGFVHAMFVWVGVARGTAAMPHGSAVGQESEGDMERLVRTYGWTKESLARTYLVVGFACLASLLVAYVVYWRRARVVARGAGVLDP